MARIFITGAADGLGQMAARLMVGDGHRGVLPDMRSRIGATRMVAPRVGNCRVIG
jgi:NAD(P)-dependent dehydrogenase (short-subunit alcohol dehydrogenase family)